MGAVTFGEWLEAVFNHSLRKPEWYWDDDFNEQWDALGMSDSLMVDYMTRLFLDHDHLRPFSKEQIAQGIWFLIGESSPGEAAHSLLKSHVPLQHRIGCVDAITNFFRDFVAPAAPGPAHERTDPFHTACYMWWDIFPTYGGPTYGPNTGGEPELHEHCLSTMGTILSISCELCQLSALHGLNHWHRNYGGRVEGIVDSFLRTPDLTNRIIEYADKARVGGAL